MHRRLAGIAVPTVLAALVVAAPARGAGAQASTAVELARFVMPEETWNRTIEAITAQTKQGMEDLLRQNGIEEVPAFVGETFDETRKLFSYAEVVDIAAGAYAKHYTEAELQELLAFYRTAVGQKTIRVLPELMQDVNGQTLALVQQRMPALIEKMKGRVEAYVASHRSGAKAPARKAK